MQLVHRVVLVLVTMVAYGVGGGGALPPASAAIPARQAAFPRDPGANGSGEASGYARFGSKRAYSNRPDAVTGPQVRFIYFVPRDSVDRHLDIDGTLAMAWAGMQGWFQRQSDGWRWRYDSTPAGIADVTFVRGLRDHADYGADGFQRELVERGFWQPRSKFLVFYEEPARAGAACGLGVAAHGHYVVGQSLAPEGAEARIVDFATAFLQATCDASRPWGTIGEPGWPQTTAMHEVIHSVGLVTLGAPHYCAFTVGHVCSGAVTPTVQGASLDPEGEDVMYPAAVHPLHEAVLDRNRDDYFMAPTRFLGSGHPPSAAKPEPFSDLSNSEFLVPPP